MHSCNNKYLFLGSICSALAAIAHLGCIIFGGDWYRFFGAGEQMARMAEDGHWYPTVVTSIIVLILSVWSLYALSGSKVIFRLPLLRLGLVVISLIYLLRGVAFMAIMPIFPENSLTFWLVSSGICLIIGTLYAVGTFQSWSQLSVKNV
ncbi:hypothetical protein [Thalassotalea sp. ND16A]|uniref:hypothetical protein n=1 Tax=Thalassotalea sp. ND16A TaxID=1535422 RepID=UPI00051A79D0|nr:hypothetical protein [Thalassotalea sp. ND16A]KGJ98564.1 hypothetical protein ND16A_0634 [Thalassotalea sp. ND16A]